MTQNFMTGSPAAVDTEILTLMLNSVSEGVVLLDSRGLVLACNDAAVEILESESVKPGKQLELWEHGLDGQPGFAALCRNLDGGSCWSGEFKNRKQSGEVSPLLARVTSAGDRAGDGKRYIVVLQDMTAAKETEDALYRLTNVDPVTSLPNRKVFFEELQRAIQRAARHGNKCGIVLLDIERFKEINDSLGHAAGDQFLQKFASLLGQVTVDEHFLSRIGGDEFAIIVEGLENDMDLAMLVEKVNRSMAEPVTVLEQEIFPAASIGIALYPDDATDAETLAQHADTALSSVKEQGTSSYQFYTQRMNAYVVKHFWIESNLRKALGTDQLIPFFQPQINLKTGRPDEAEVLIRWRHPQLGMVSPGDFIPIAEKTGIIEAISADFLAATCAQFKEWKKARLPLKVLAVNLSARLFTLKDLAEQIFDCTRRFDLAPEDLLLEITETTIMTQPEMADAILMALKEMGFKIAIDDFGTGYSSLSYLHRFSVDQVKIDRSFVVGIATSAESRSIVKAIIAMCSSLGLETLAEGVETEDQLRILQSLGCDKAQGFFMSRPLSAPDFEDYLHRHPGNN